MATVVDPRYHTKPFEHLGVSKTVTKVTKWLVEETKAQSQGAPPTTVQPDDDVAKQPSPKRSRLSVEFVNPLSCLADMLDDDGPRDTVNYKQQVDAYLSQPRLPLHKDPLAWWSANQHLYKEGAARRASLLVCPTHVGRK